MAVVDTIAREVGVRWVRTNVDWPKPKQSRARRTCMRLIRQHGPSHLRLVFKLIDSEINASAWNSDVIKAVSMLVSQREDLTRRRHFVEAIWDTDLNALRDMARKNAAGTAGAREGLFHILAYEIEGRVSEMEREVA